MRPQVSSHLVKLTKVQIRQFRSIAEMDIAFHRNCLVLLGVNESGKTNILEALALLSSDRNVQPADRRQPSSEERPDQESFVRFVFTLTDDEKQSIKERTLTRICGDADQLGIVFASQDMTLPAVVERIAREGLFRVDTDDARKYTSVWRMDDEVALAEGWLVPKPDCPDSVRITHVERGRVAAKEFALVARSCLADENQLTWFREATGNDLINDIQSQTRQRVREELPECVYWSYARDDALPQSIPWKAFRDSPSSFPVIENMFRLAGYNDPNKDIEAASKSPTGVRRLLERVGTLVTKTLRQTWDDFGELAIELHENGSNLECIIRDAEGAFAFKQRSDGFRRFVSFLLLVSCRNTSGTFSDGILLYDEPDTSLHPSGARQLRNELLRLSESNCVVYSTHSIFMVDPDEIERHLIVTKNREKTEAKVAAPGTLRDEEVLYQAVGHTVYDVLKRRNVILEGWRDKRMIECGLKLTPPEIQGFFEDVGLCHARGVTKVPNVAPMVEMLGRPYLVLSDSDTVAKETRDDEDSRWPWKLYEEFTESKFQTAEDFIKEESLRRFVNSASLQTAELRALDLRFDQPFVEMVKSGLVKGGMKKDSLKQTVSRLKELIFAQLAPADLRPEIVTLLVGVRDELLRQ